MPTGTFSSKIMSPYLSKCQAVPYPVFLKVNIGLTRSQNHVLGIGGLKETFEAIYSTSLFFRRKNPDFLTTTSQVIAILQPNPEYPDFSSLCWLQNTLTFSLCEIFHQSSILLLSTFSWSGVVKGERRPCFENLLFISLFYNLLQNFLWELCITQWNLSPQCSPL